MRGTLPDDHIDVTDARHLRGCRLERQYSRFQREPVRGHIVSRRGLCRAPMTELRSGHHRTRARAGAHPCRNVRMFG